MKNLSDALENLIYVGQLGLDLLMPLVLCLLLCTWLVNRFGCGGWIYVPGIFLGLGSGALNFYKFWQRQKNRMKKEHPDEKPPVGFSKHI